jgi:regulator of nucleoside diphosphate kinase
MDHSYSTENMPEIKITKGDLSRLELLLATHEGIWSWRAVEFLVRELLRSTIVRESQISAGTVTMRSRVEYCEDDGIPQVVTLVYPGERDLYDDAMSILTPVGAALIGLTEGQAISYGAPDGTPKTIKVLRVLYQPEANRRAAKAARGRPNPLAS